MLCISSFWCNDEGYYVPITRALLAQLGAKNAHLAITSQQELQTALAEGVIPYEVQVAWIADLNTIGRLQRSNPLFLIENNHLQREQLHALKLAQQQLLSSPSLTAAQELAILQKLRDNPALRAIPQTEKWAKVFKQVAMLPEDIRQYIINLATNNEVLIKPQHLATAERMLPLFLQTPAGKVQFTRDHLTEAQVAAGGNNHFTPQTLDDQLLECDAFNRTERRFVPQKIGGRPTSRYDRLRAYYEERNTPLQHSLHLLCTLQDIKEAPLHANAPEWSYLLQAIAKLPLTNQIAFCNSITGNVEYISNAMINSTAITSPHALQLKTRAGMVHFQLKTEQGSHFVPVALNGQSLTCQFVEQPQAQYIPTHVNNEARPAYLQRFQAKHEQRSRAEQVIIDRAEAVQASRGKVKEL